jgi:hypothetical protein
MTPSYKYFLSTQSLLIIWYKSALIFLKLTFPFSLIYGFALFSCLFILLRLLKFLLCHDLLNRAFSFLFNLAKVCELLK